MLWECMGAGHLWTDPSAISTWLSAAVDVGTVLNKGVS